MGTAFFSCGCYISTDMFNGSIIEVHPCPKHAQVPEIQALLVRLAQLVRELDREEDG